MNFAVGYGAALLLIAAYIAWALRRLKRTRPGIDMTRLTDDDPREATADETLDRVGRYVTLEEHADQAIAIVQPRSQFRRLTAQDYGDAAEARRWRP